jgi:hypothetical protein
LRDNWTKSIGYRRLVFEEESRRELRTEEREKSFDGFFDSDAVFLLLAEKFPEEAPRPCSSKRTSVNKSTR